MYAKGASVSDEGYFIFEIFGEISKISVSDISKKNHCAKNAITNNDCVRT